MKFAYLNMYTTCIFTLKDSENELLDSPDQLAAIPEN